MDDKRGLSDVVAAVMMILIVVVAIGVIAITITRSLNTLSSSVNNTANYLSNTSNFASNQNTSAATNQVQNSAVYSENPYNGVIPPVPTNDNVLCVYNSDNSNSTQICDYYLQKRPGASELGLSIPDSEFMNDTEGNGGRSYVFSREDMNISSFRNDVYNPIMSWVNAHPDKKITHLAIAKDLPIRVYVPNQGYGLVLAAEYVLSYAGNYSDSNSANNFLNTIGTNSSYIYYGRIHFDPNNYKDPSGNVYTRFAVSFLDAYTLEDVKEMIDKANSPIQNLSTDKWLISRDSDQFSVTEQDLLSTQSALINSGVNSSNVALDRTDATPTILNGTVIAFGGPGIYHNGFIWNWMTQSIDFSVDDRAIFTSYESYNAVSFWGNSSLYGPYRIGQPQSLLSDGFAPEAVGGTNYSRSFSGAAGSVDEPSLSGVVAMAGFFGSYASGLTLAESFLSGDLYNVHNMVVGDPLMSISDSSQSKEPVGYICGSNQDCSSNVCSKDLSNTMRCASDSTSCIFDSAGHEVVNGATLCLNITDTTTCSNGQWQSITYCGDSNICVNNPNVSYYTNPLVYQGVCKIQNGQVCRADQDCAFGSICSADIYGTKRCNSALTGCVFDNSGVTVTNNSYACNTDSSKKLCLNNVWQSKIACSSVCQDGSCLGQDDIFTQPNILNLSVGQEYAMTLPLNATFGNLSLIFANAPVPTLFSYWKGNSWNGAYLRYGSNSPIIITPGMGFYFTLGPNYKSLNSTGSIVATPAVTYTTQINGTPLTSPVSVNIGGMYSFIGVPYCGNKYTASSVIREINSIEPRCYMISTINTGHGQPYWFSLNPNLNVSGIQRDFNLTNFNAYGIYCNSTSVNFNWTPSCSPR